MADLVARAIDAASAPKVAKRGPVSTQAIYNYRDGRLPSRMAIAPLARCLRIPRAELETLVAQDEADRSAAAGAA